MSRKDNDNQSSDKPPPLPVYLCADQKDKGTIKANRVHKETWEKFKIKFIDRKRFCLQAMANDKFVRVKDKKLIADIEDVEPPHPSCLFEIEIEIK